MTAIYLLIYICSLSEVMMTLYYNTDVYHCVFGNLEESLQSCCQNAMEEASREKMRTVVFWLDGFASLSGSYVYTYIRTCVV